MSAGIDAALAAMRQRYVESSKGLIATFELIGRQLATSPSSDDLITTLRRELHRVHGTAGSLGFDEAGRMAGAMEGVVRRWHADAALDAVRRSSIVLNFARGLRDAIAVTPEAEAPPSRRVILIGLPDWIADAVAAEGLHRGLAVERCADAQCLGEKGSGAWGIIAMDDALPAGEEAFATPHVLLSAEAGAPRGANTGRATLLDADTSPARIFDVLAAQATEREGRELVTVLLVDDDPLMLLLVRALAEDEGLDVETAASGAEFFDALEKHSPALVVLDIELQDASGIDLLKHVRAHPVHHGVPVLMLSGRSDEQARTAAFDAGANDYMFKPIVPAELQRRLATLLDARRERLAEVRVEPGTGLPLAARALDELEARLSVRGDQQWTVGVVKPKQHAYTPDETSAWQAECTRLAKAVKEEGGTVGLMETPGLVIGLPLSPRDANDLLRSVADSAEGGAPAWHAGVAAATTGSPVTLRTLVAAATDACAAAHDAGSRVRIWDASDAAISPDVIVVEDDASLREMLEFALEAKGLSHRSYDNGPDALEGLLRLRPGDRSPIVLLDIDLPGMDGHSLHERLRLERPGVFHVVFLSLHTSDADQLRALHGGALDYLTKPISLRVLMAKLTLWRQRLRRA